MAQLRATVVELEEERVRLLRERRIHLILLGLAVSLPVHIAIIIWLASVYLPGQVGFGAPSVNFEMSMLGDDSLAEASGSEGDGMAVEDSLGGPSGSEGPVSLEASSPAIGLGGGTGSGSLEAGGSGPSGEGGFGGGGGGSGGGLGPGGGSGGTSFFGVGGRGTRFAYIVDISGSMSTGNRMQVAMDELKRSVSSLPDFASFAIFLYSDHSLEPPFQEGFMRAMPGNVTRVKRWLDEQSPMGGTEPGTAFERALALNPPPDLIFFLTDGEIPDNVPGYLASRNGTNGKKRIVIHCIAFSTDASQDSLRRIARESEGTFRFVPVNGIP